MIFSFLNKPYPYIGNFKRNLLVNFAIGCFIAFFLIVFEPFGINYWHTSSKLLKLAGFGVVSFIVPTVVGVMISLLFRRKILEESWRIWTEILSIVTVLCFIALGNMLYGNFIDTIPFSFQNYLIALSTVLLVGIFPVTFHVILKHNKLLKINYEKAFSINLHLNHTENPEQIQEQSSDSGESLKLVLVAENQKDKISLHPAQLFYIESADNYSSVVYAENDKQKKQLIRSSLKRVETQLNYDNIIRCHRAYIVNLDNVKKVDGNAAGYRLTFHNSNDSIPVSRTYSSLVLKKLGRI